MSLPLTNETKVIELTPEFAWHAWTLLQRVNHGSIWYELDGLTPEGFIGRLQDSPAILGWPFGLAFFSHVIPGHAARVHALFWKRPDPLVIRQAGDDLLKKLNRLEVVVPTVGGRLPQLLADSGFMFEGIMRRFYKTGTKLVDAALWART